MSAEHRSKTAAAFSELWEARPIKRIRAGDDVLVLRGRRVSAHLMMQPNVSAMLLADALLAEQGLLSRILICRTGELDRDAVLRTILAPTSDQAIKAYEDRLLEIFETPPPLAPGKVNELDPRALVLTRRRTSRSGSASPTTPSARWRRAALTSSIRGLGQQAAGACRPDRRRARPDRRPPGQRDRDIPTGGRDRARSTTTPSEALRLHAAGMADPDLVLAAAPAGLAAHALAGPVSLPDVYQKGPRPIRNAAIAAKIMTILEEHGWLRREPEGAEINGVWRRTVWTVTRS